jgi:hypothetical protein
MQKRFNSVKFFPFPIEIPTIRAYNKGMRTISRTVIVALIAFAAIAWGWRGAPAQTNSEYFDETGHSVTGEFLTFYRSIPDPELIYGYPITETFRDSRTGLQVQYFQKARFELHLAETAGNRVQLTPLGRELYEPGQPELALANTTACRTFPNIRFQICYVFLDFFSKHGGLAQFGYPISNMEQHNGITVQYFERARLEWRPGMNGSSAILLTPLGMQYFEKLGEASTQLLPVKPPSDSAIGALDPPVKTLKARAFPASAVTKRSGEQTVYVLVQDQRSLPVAHAIVSGTVYLPSGQKQNFIALSETNDQGITKIQFRFQSSQVGMARVEAKVTLDGKEVLAYTSFRIWW